MTLTNISECAATQVDPGNFLGSLHTAKIGPDYLSHILIHNTGTAAVKAVFDVYDSDSGAKVGSVQTGKSIDANASVFLDVPSALQSIGFTSSMDHSRDNT